MAHPLEPTIARLPHPVMRYVAATRPTFLSVTCVGCLLGMATAFASGVATHLATALATLLFALLASAGANVINDYYDALSGCDAANDDRVFPFSGGSRVIQNGVLSLRAVKIFGHALLLIVIPAGIWLTLLSGPGLLAIGLLGLLAGWAYSAPPLKLQARGLGEFAIALAWLLIVVGSDYVQRHGFSFVPVAAGLGFALLVANILYINQFPDIRADTLTGKRTLVVRLGVRRARRGYALIGTLAYGWIVLMVAGQQLTPAALASLLPAFASYRAARDLARHAAQPVRLVPAMKLTILAAIMHGLLLTGTLLLA